MVLELGRLEELTEEGVLAHSILDGVRAVQERMQEEEKEEHSEKEMEDDEWQR